MDNLQSIRDTRRQRVSDFEVWWQTHPERWPNLPRGYYIGPDGRLLSPADFAAYAADPHRLIYVFGGGQPARDGRPAGAYREPRTYPGL